MGISKPLICCWNVVGHVVGMSDLPLPAICGEENARGFWSKLPINECVEILPEVEPGLNKGRLKVYVSLLECVDFAGLFCVLGKQNCGQREDLFWREIFHKSVRPRPTGFFDVFAVFDPDLSGAPKDNFQENICSEDDLRSRIFETFVVKFLACLPLLGFSNIYEMV